MQKNEKIIGSIKELGGRTAKYRAKYLDLAFIKSVPTPGKEEAFRAFMQIAFWLKAESANSWEKIAACFETIVQINKDWLR